LISIAGGYGH
jgi:hypothetical protein